MIKSIDEIVDRGNEEEELMFNDAVNWASRQNSMSGYCTTAYYYTHRYSKFAWCREEDAEMRQLCIHDRSHIKALQYYIPCAFKGNSDHFLEYINAVEKAHDFKGELTSIVQREALEDTPNGEIVMFKVNKEWLMSPTLWQTFTYFHRLIAMIENGYLDHDADYYMDMSRLDGKDMCSIFKDNLGTSCGDSYREKYHYSEDHFNIIVKNRHLLFGGPLDEEWRDDTYESAHGNSTPFSLFTYSGPWAFSMAIKDKVFGCEDRQCPYFKFISKGDLIMGVTKSG